VIGFSPSVFGRAKTQLCLLDILAAAFGERMKSGIKGKALGDD